MNDPTMFAAGAAASMVIAALVTTPVFHSWRKAMKEAREIIQAQQDDIDSLFEILPMRLPNGRFAKRQENNHG